MGSIDDRIISSLMIGGACLAAFPFFRTLPPVGLTLLSVVTIGHSYYIWKGLYDCYEKFRKLLPQVVNNRRRNLGNLHLGSSRSIGSHDHIARAALV